MRQRSRFQPLQISSALLLLVMLSIQVASKADAVLYVCFVFLLSSGGLVEKKFTLTTLLRCLVCGVRVTWVILKNRVDLLKRLCCKFEIRVDVCVDLNLTWLTTAAATESTTAEQEQPRVLTTHVTAVRSAY